MIPNISEHIRILLFTNECVIVPGLGGFISNSKPVIFDASNIVPSSKKPFFNRQLKNNDGLLAAYISQKENLSYTEALAEIDRFSKAVAEQLTDTKQSVLRGLGILQENEEGMISFIPSEEVNVLDHSYGLPILSIQPLKKAAQTKFREASPIKTGQKKEIKIRTSFWWTSAAASILLAMGIWGYFAKDQWWPQHEQMAIINPFDTGSKNSISEKTETPVQTEENYSTEKIEESTEVIEAPVINESIEAEKATVNNTSLNTDSVYYIVVGAFKSENNALKLERKIKAKGYSTSVYQSDNTEWIRVCAEHHTKRFEAEERLDLVRTDASPNAWILAVKP